MQRLKLAGVVTAGILVASNGALAQDAEGEAGGTSTEARPDSAAPSSETSPDESDDASSATAGGTATASLGATGASAETSSEVGMGLPGQEGLGAHEASGSDHDSVVGTFGIGFLGVREMRLGEGVGEINAIPSQTTHAPVIGARYWITRLIGIDGGVGFWFNGGSDKLEDPDPANTNPREGNVAGITTAIVHVGVPLALANAGHFSFQVVPEVNAGYSTQKLETDALTVENTGLHLDGGVRGGAEIHFGFIKLPRLSLQGSIGLLFSYDQVQSKETAGGNERKATQTRMSLSTMTNSDPWHIFAGNIAALYYF